MEECCLAAIISAQKPVEATMLGKVLCVLGGVVLGYIAREEISEVVENVMETFSEQSSSEVGSLLWTSQRQN